MVHPLAWCFIVVVYSRRSRVVKCSLQGTPICTDLQSLSNFLTYFNEEVTLELDLLQIVGWPCLETGYLPNSSSNISGHPTICSRSNSSVLFIPGL